MANTKPSAIDYTDMSNTVQNFQVEHEDTDFSDYTTDWSKWYGYYLDCVPFQAMIDKKATWTVGKGFQAKPAVKKRLDRIRGMGKDTFNTIMHNAVKTYSIGGDFIAEIVSTKRNDLVNLKPLNPGAFQIKANSKGIIKKYNQLENTGNSPDTYSKPNILQSYDPDEIFHLAWNRTADQTHGIGITQKMEPTLKKFKEATNDLQTVFHRYVKPLWIFAVDTDNENEIADFKAKADATVDKAENMVVPKDTVDKIERVSIPPNSTLDPLPWIRYLEQQFIMAEGVPYVIMGLDQQTPEASAKILYLGWQQVVEWNQKFLSEQIKAQLNIDLQFEFPASIAPELISDQKKKGTKDNTASLNNSDRQE